jgi:hypothetical protein
MDVHARIHASTHTHTNTHTPEQEAAAARELDKLAQAQEQRIEIEHLEQQCMRQASNELQCAVIVRAKV